MSFVLNFNYVLYQAKEYLCSFPHVVNGFNAASAILDLRYGYKQVITSHVSHNLVTTARLTVLSIFMHVRSVSVVGLYLIIKVRSFSFQLVIGSYLLSYLLYIHTSTVIMRLQIRMIVSK